MTEIAPELPAARAVPKDTFVNDQLPYLIATGGEFIGLFFFLHFWDQGGTRGVILASIILLAGFITERVAVMRWANYFRAKMEAKYGVPSGASTEGATPKPLALLGKLLLICLTEITIWVTFVLVYDAYGWPFAIAVLFIGEQLQHAWDFALIARRPIAEYIPSPNALFITLVEAGAGIAWLWLVRHGQPQLGGAALLLGLTIEHVVQSKRIKLDLERDVREKAALPTAAAAGAVGA